MDWFAKSIMAVVAVLALAGLIRAQTFADANSSATDYKSLVGKKIAVEVGSPLHNLEELIGATPVFYTDPSVILEDMRRGRIDGYIIDLSHARAIIKAGIREDMRFVNIPSEVFDLRLIVVADKRSGEQMDRFNAFLAELKADGTLEEMRLRWIVNYPNSQMPDIPLADENGVITAVTCAEAPPYSYVGDEGQLKGYSVELAKRFARSMGMDVKFVKTDWDALLVHVAIGKSDFVFDLIAYDEERCQTVLCSDPIYNDTVTVLMLKHHAYMPEKTRAGAIGWLKTGIERNLVKEKRWMLIVDGLKVTVTISVLAQIFATALGLFVCYLLSRKNRVVSYAARFYEWLIHGTPMVVLLLIVYYIIFGKTDISPILVAVAAFAMVGSVNIGASLYSAILTIDKTEVEAARSMGFTPLGAFMSVTFPQAVKRALPGYLSGFVDLMKETAIVGFIAIQDLSRAGDIIRSRTYDAYFPLLFVAAIYLVVTTVCITIFKSIIKRINARGLA